MQLDALLKAIAPLEKAAMQTAAEDMIGRVRRELERTRGDG